ncbi:hypothetical protein [Streptomyces olivoreticuli]|uniref:hypothetical protein n=1 Tax=Streptomyces olivoreticuli TaxID=68246 RepID=UPI000E272CF1|nr:hypothetical protein [Streptomyces olivoreticuli]
MKYGDLLIVDELHRLDRVAAALLQSLIKGWLSEPARRPAEDDQSERAGRHQAAGPPGAVPAGAGTAEHLRHATAAISELVDLLGVEEGLTGAQARRAAELLELMDADEEAVRWWKLAAELGDADAVDYLALLEEEGTSSAQKPARGHTPCPRGDDVSAVVPSAALSKELRGEPVPGGGDRDRAMANSIRRATAARTRRRLQGLLSTAQRLARTAVAEHPADDDEVWITTGEAALLASGSG